MANPMGEAGCEALRLDFDRCLLLQFRGNVITSDGGLLEADQDPRKVVSHGRWMTFQLAEVRGSAADV